MTQHTILGAGPAGVVAAETLRALDANADIAIIGDEPEPPYSRMAIPYLLQNNIDEGGTYLRKDDGYFAARGIEVVQGRAAAVEVAANAVTLADGGARNYDKLLLATGATPITPPIAGIDHPRVSSCWTLEDARRIAAGIRPGAPVVQIGAGFIGCIILEALVAAGAELTVVETGDRMVPRMLDETCGGLLQKWCEAKGVRVLTGATVRAIEDAGDGVAVQIDGRDALPAELVISAVGVRANADFLGDAVVLRDGAVLVDEFMASSAPGVYAAGDVACGRDFSTGDYSVQAIQPTAVEHARVAANNMHRHGSVRHIGAMPMNVLDTIGLISASYGNWRGVDSAAGGEFGELLDADNYKYIRLCFADDRLVGANTLGFTQHIGILRGLIQGKFRLGKWKDRLRENPLQVMEAYLAATQG